MFGQAATVTATVLVVAPGAGTPTGSVTFLDGATPLATVPLTGGSASASTSALAPGVHTISVQYSGDADDTPSTSAPVSFTVSQDTTTTAVGAMPNPTVFGQAVTVTATVSVVAPGAGTPTGSVTFFDGGTPIGTSSLSSGAATLNTATLGVGPHTITAQFLGSPNQAPTTSGILMFMVNMAPTTTSISASPAAGSVFGQAATFTATVSVVAPGAGTPTGTVTFLDGATPLATVRLTGASASFSTNALALGVHTISMQYSGDADQAPNTSGVLTFTVKAATTTIVPGRIVGEGAITDGARRHEFEFDVRENATGGERGTLEYRLATEQSGRNYVGRFRSSHVTTVVFSDAPGTSSGRRPLSGIDHVAFSGIGTWNGEAGYSFDAAALDAGEPSRGRDRFTLRIRNNHGVVVATVDGLLTDGNIQSLR